MKNSITLFFGLFLIAPGLHASEHILPAEQTKSYATTPLLTQQQQQPNYHTVVIRDRVEHPRADVVIHRSECLGEPCRSCGITWEHPREAILTVVACGALFLWVYMKQLVN